MAVRMPDALKQSVTKFVLTNGRKSKLLLMKPENIAQFRKVLHMFRQESRIFAQNWLTL
jgi:hypothetical protein